MKLSTRARVFAVVAGAGLLAPAIAAPPFVVILAIGSQPDTDAPTMQQAGALFRQQKFAEAAALYEKIIEGEPENARAWFQMGYCLHVTGDLARAIPAHKKAASLAPDGSQFKILGLYNLGCAYALQGETDAAFVALMEAVDAGFATPENVSTVSTDSDLDSLRDDERFSEFTGRMRAAGRSPTLKQFDFWIGTWDVYNRKGKLIGKNNIKSLDAGLILMENWTAPDGGGGRSMNYYEPVSRRWKQVWVDANGVLETSGVWEGGSLRFRGERKMRNGQVKQHKMVFTPDGHGNVRQLIHESDDGENWEVYFDGLYVPAGSDSPGAWGSDSETGSVASAKPARATEAGLAGTWDMVIESDEGTLEMRLTFIDKNGEMRGVISMGNEEMPMSTVKLEGDALTMKLTTPNQDVYDFTGTISGNAIKGVWLDSDGQEFGATATRADI